MKKLRTTVFLALTLIFVYSMSVYAALPLQMAEDSFDLFSSPKITLYSRGEEQEEYSEAKSKIYEGLKDKDERISIWKYSIKVEDFSEIYGEIVLAYPDLIYVTNRWRYTHIGEYMYEIYPIYDSEITDKEIEKFNKEVDRILEDVVEDGMSEEDITLALHDYIVQSCEYDFDIDPADAQTYLHSDFTAYGAIVKKKAVCQGYTLAYELLLQKSGIENIFVSSGDMGHSWNLVKLHDKWYHVDTTWDDTNFGYGDRPGSCMHKYFLLSDAGIREDHYNWDSAGHVANDAKYEDSSLPFYDNYSIFFYRDGKFYYEKDSKIYRGSFDGKEKEKIIDNTATGQSGIMLLDDNNIYYISSSGKEVYYANIKTLKTKKIATSRSYIGALEIDNNVLSWYGWEDYTRKLGEFNIPIIEGDCSILSSTYNESKVSADIMNITNEPVTALVAIYSKDNTLLGIKLFDIPKESEESIEKNVVEKDADHYKIMIVSKEKIMPLSKPLFDLIK